MHVWTLDICGSWIFGPAAAVGAKGFLRPQLDGAGGARKCQDGRKGCNGPTGMIFARFFVATIFAIVISRGAGAQEAEFFPDGIYRDLSAAWFKSTYGVMGKGLSFPEDPGCEKDAQRPGEFMCIVGNDLYDLVISGKSPIEGIGLRNIMIVIRNYKDLRLAENLVRIASGVIDRSLINDFQFRREVEQGLLREEGNIIFRKTVRVFIDPYNPKGGISVILLPPTRMPPK